MDSDTVDSACNGELTGSAFAFAEENATCSEASHSYAVKKGTRKVSKTKTCPPTVSRLLTWTPMEQQSVPITLEADQSSFQSHEGADLCW